MNPVASGLSTAGLAVDLVGFLLIAWDLHKPVLQRPMFANEATRWGFYLVVTGVALQLAGALWPWFF